MGGNKSAPFITVWKTDNTDADSTAANQIKLPFQATTVIPSKLKIDWGDGTIVNVPAGTVGSNSLFTHTYSTSGIYEVKIYGHINTWQWGSSYKVDRNKIIEVKQWGGFKPYDRQGLFWECNNVTMANVVDVLDLSECISLQHAFFRNYSNTYINRIEEWDVTNLSGSQALSSTFSFAQQFNQDLSSWASKVGNIINMSNAFQNATSFNKDLSSWVPYMNLNVNLQNFMLGKSSANYDYQHVDNFLIAMASRSWAGRSQAKTISFGTCQRSTNSTTAYDALVLDGWTIGLSATVITP